MSFYRDRGQHNNKDDNYNDNNMSRRMQEKLDQANHIQDLKYKMDEALISNFTKEEVINIRYCKSSIFNYLRMNGNIEILFQNQNQKLLVEFIRITFELLTDSETVSLQDCLKIQRLSRNNVNLATSRIKKYFCDSKNILEAVDLDWLNYWQPTEIKITKKMVITQSIKQAIKNIIVISRYSEEITGISLEEETKKSSL